MRRKISWIVIISLAAVGFAVISACELFDTTEEATFTTRVEVLSESSTPISPVVWAVHSDDNPFFDPGTTTRLSGLESLAEDGDPSALGSAVGDLDDVLVSGVMNTPTGSTAPGPAIPGSSYTFTFDAEEGDKLSFVTMYVQSNDLFFSPDNSGIDLFPDGEALSGEVTLQINLYDAGTEVNEEPGVGPNQAPRQPAPDTGTGETEPVRLISEVNDGFTYPTVSQVIRVTITPEE